MSTELPKDALLLGRMWEPSVSGPCVVTVRDGVVFDVTARAAPLARDICEMAAPAAYLRGVEGRRVAPLADLIAAPTDDPGVAHLLAPCDLQAVKACGVTFAGSMVERVIEGRAGGDPARRDDPPPGRRGDRCLAARHPPRIAPSPGSQGRTDRRGPVEPVS